MKSFIIKIGVYAMLVVLGLLCFELSLYTQENEYSYKKHYIESHLDDIKVLTLGSSLFEISVDPSMIGEGVFNGNLSGIGSLYANSATYQMACEYVPKMKNLKTLIVTFPINEVYRGSGDWEFIQRPASRTCQCMRVKYLHALTDVRDIVYWSELINSKMDYVGRFKKTDYATRICDSLGFRSNNRDLKDRKKGWDSAYIMKPDEWKEHLLNYKKTSDDTRFVVEAYNDVAELCKKRGVNLIAIATPYYKTRTDQITEKEIADYHFAVAEIKKKHPEVQFYDFTYDKRFTSDDFQDPLHLNNNGARKFSLIIKNEILKW